MPFLLGTKVAYSGDTKSVSKGLILATMTFETILYTVLQRLIRQKLLKDSGFLHL